MPAERHVRVRAFAKINLALRILGVRDDGYHELRTTYQSIALHDTLTFDAAPGAFRIECDDPACPTDRTNLVWQAVERTWRAARCRGVPRDLVVRIEKRIPMQAGLGGGSSDAAAVLGALAALWRARISRDVMQSIASELGADVPFFLEGGTALGLERGNLIFPLIDAPASWVVLVIPGFGVSTRDAYEWFDRNRRAEEPAKKSRTAEAAETAEKKILSTLGELCVLRGRTSDFLTASGGNDLQAPVSRHHPEIARIVGALGRQGASHAALSGSGSAVFGLFGSRPAAASAARAVARGTRRTLVTRTIDHARYARLARVGSG